MSVEERWLPIASRVLQRDHLIPLKGCAVVFRGVSASTHRDDLELGLDVLSVRQRRRLSLFVLVG